MDIYQISLIFVPVVSAGIGFLFKYYTQSAIEYRNTLKKERIEEIEKNLNNFYFPLFVNLFREDTLYRNIIKLNKNDKKYIIFEENRLTQSKLKKIISKVVPNFFLCGKKNNITNNQPLDELISHPIEISSIEINDPVFLESFKRNIDDEFLKIHLENEELIVKWIMVVNPKNSIGKIIIKYLQHILIYKLIKCNNGVDSVFPSDFGIEYPYGIKDTIENEVRELRQELLKLKK